MTALRLSEAAERLRFVEREHEALLRRVEKRRAEIERLDGEIHTAAADVATRMAPLLEEARRLDEALHALFEALVSDEKRSKRQRTQIRRLHLQLQEAGVLSPRGDAAPPLLDDEDDDERAHHHAPHGRGTEERIAVAPARDERGALRDLFRRLVEALHPDHAEDEADHARRTEIMKQVTVAYREGDFARLVEIERAWATAAATNREDVDEIERRRLALEEANARLRRQLRELERELRHARRSGHGQLASALRGARGRDALLDDLLAPAADEVETLRRMYDFTASFRDGKITLAELLDGPDCEVDDEVEQTLEEMLAGLFGARPARRRPAARR